MMTKMDGSFLTRRTLIKTIAAAGFAECAVAAQPFRVGVVPAGVWPPGGQIEAFWAHCAEESNLGFRYVEVNNTRARIAKAYIGRAAEFQESMAKHNLVLAGLALFSQASDASLKDELIPQHLLLGNFLKASGGAYVTHMIAPGPVLNESNNPEEYRLIDFAAWVRNANEIGKALWGAFGVKLGYHPELEGVRAGLYERFLDMTDPRFVFFIPDTGHLAAAGGADALAVCTKYRSRLAAIHLKDFAPDGRTVKAGNVPLGEGVVHLAEIAQFLRESNFSGYVMAESGGTNPHVHKYLTGTLHLNP